MELVAARPVGPAKLKHKIEPFLDDGRRRIPVEGMLQHDEIMIEEKRLLMADIDGEIGIGGIEVVKSDAGQVADGVMKGTLDMRTGQAGMGKEDEDLHEISKIEDADRSGQGTRISSRRQ